MRIGNHTNVWQSEKIDQFLVRKTSIIIYYLDLFAILELLVLESQIAYLEDVLWHCSRKFKIKNALEWNFLICSKLNSVRFVLFDNA